MGTEPSADRAAAATLDPPGTIAVVGAGPLGIEAALYGRYLGYDVTLFEALSVASSITHRRDAPIPMMPDQCASPLARSALAAQAGTAEPRSSPLVIGQWIDEIWVPLTETDLLRGRLRCPAAVQAIEPIPVAEDEPGEEESAGETADNAAEPIPPDFRLSFGDGETADFEAVILATGQGDPAITFRFDLPADYFFQIGAASQGAPEHDFTAGLKEIVAAYASLAGRHDLDLYRPRRG